MVLENKNGCGKNFQEVPQTLEAVRRDHILNIWQLCDGNAAQAAHVLGISEELLLRMIREYGVKDIEAPRNIPEIPRSQMEEGREDG